MENTNDSTSGINTVLIVIVLVLLVGFGVWWFTAHKSAPAKDSNDFKIDVSLPGGNPSPSPSPTPSPSPSSGGAAY